MVFVSPSKLKFILKLLVILHANKFINLQGKVNAIFSKSRYNKENCWPFLVNTFYESWNLEFIDCSVQFSSCSQNNEVSVSGVERVFSPHSVRRVS